MARLKAQIGVEKVVNGRRTVRLTPVSETFDVSETVAGLLLLAGAVVDGQDIQPGDGEIDLPLESALGELSKRFPALGSLDLPGFNAFLRIVRVA